MKMKIIKLSLSHYLYIFSIIFICRLLVCITRALIFHHMYYDVILRNSLVCLAIYIYLHYCIMCIFFVDKESASDMDGFYNDVYLPYCKKNKIKATSNIYFRSIIDEKCSKKYYNLAPNDNTKDIFGNDRPHNTNNITYEQIDAIK
jgi:hypothetical protein